VRLTQGAFSFLPDLTDEQIKKQVEFCISKGWAVNLEWSDDVHPRNTYWDLWGLPLFDIKDPAAVMYELAECRKANPTGYIKLQAFDAARFVESTVYAIIVQRPSYEPGFYIERTEGAGRFQRYQFSSYAVQAKPAGERY
jgi:ribulose-bisphosphate carboxylase small chain